MQSNFFIGIVEDRNDPLMIGRVRARVVGLHIHDKTILPTTDLPWAMVMQPATSTSGMGSVAAGPAEGTSVIVIFNDFPANQQPIIIGALGGIPQQQQVFIDRFEDTPLFKDDITPAGRTIPTTAEGVNANQTGPVTSPNPTLSSLVNQGRQESSKTTPGLVETTLSGTAASFEAVGNKLGGIGGVGSTFGSLKNQFEDTIIETGNRDVALTTFVNEAAASGELGNKLASVFEGASTLQLLERQFNIPISGFEAIINLAGGSTSISSLIQGAENALKDIAQNAISSVFGSFGGLASLGNLAGSVDNLIDDARDDFESLFKTGISSVQAVNQGLQGAATSLTTALVGEGGIAVESAPIDIVPTPIIAAGPDAVADALLTTYNSEAQLAENVGNIEVTTIIPMKEIDIVAFEGVPEGTTPPVFGSYGGPNFGGASPKLEAPPPTDLKRYPGGADGPIPIEPPPKSTTDIAAATANIKLLLEACDKYGLKTKEQKAALLGIVGGECGWIPKAESAQYSNPDRLLQIFPSTFKGKRDLAENYCNWVVGKKGQPPEFFNYVYDPANNGKQLGNSKPGDGGKFYGRGFIQLTGRSNYERYARLSGHPLDEDPDLLVRDPKVSAEIAVLYLMDRVAKGVVPTAHPGYFYAAKQSVGNNSPDIAARKLQYYEHFYGIKTPGTYGYCDKTAGNTQNPFSYHGGLAGNEAGKVDNNGFQDPHKKYPLKRYQAEQETNRLARGVIKETVVPLKESKRTIGVPLPLGSGNFSEPPIPFGAQYPYNRVTETESGHIQEFDDTPGHERIHTYHRSGTYEEIDSNGTKVTKIVGDNYIIIDRNGFISIAGDANLTVNGNVNIFCRSDANIEVAGSAEMRVGGNFDIGVARDMNIAVEGNFSLWANGGMNLQSRKKGHIMTTEDNLYIGSNKAMHIVSEEDMYIKTAMNQHTTVAMNHYLLATETVNITSGQSIKLTPPPPLLGSGAKPPTPALKALVHGMVPPPLGVPLYPTVEPLVGPAPLGEENFMYETPTETGTKANQAYAREQQSQTGVSNTAESETDPGTGGGGAILQSAKQKEILAMSTFTADYRLSKHFTLGMMFDGGFNAKHRLVDQNGLTKQQIVANLSALCENILERYLEELPDGIQGYRRKWFITSGYRMGASKSDHAKGRACDIQLAGRDKKQHYDLIKKLDKLVPYDQLLLEYQGPQSVWIHTGFRGNSNTTFGGGSNRSQAATVVVDTNQFIPGFSLRA